MTEQLSRGPQFVDRDQAPGTAVNMPVGMMPPIRRLALLPSANTGSGPADRCPPIRRPERLAGHRRDKVPPEGRPAGRASQTGWWLVLLLLVAGACAAWYFMPPSWLSGWRGRLVPEPVIEATAPQPSPVVLAELEDALNRGDIAAARHLLDQARSEGADVALPSEHLAGLESEQRHIMSDSFELAERDGDSGAMTRISAAFAALWPEDSVLEDWQKRTTAVETALERIVRVQELRGSYVLNLSQRQLYKAERDLADLSRLGEDVAADRAKLIRTVPLGNGVALTLRFIPKGHFTMGSPAQEKERGDDELAHRVTLSHDFWMAETEVTQAQWAALMDGNRSTFKGADQPVENINLSEVNLFIEKLNEKQPGGAFRLPTEAEWEYACRAGTTTPFNTGASLSTEQANYDGGYPYPGGSPGQYRSRTVAVKSMPPNAWGLYHMHGNVWEWCGDYFNTYPEQAVVDPVGAIWFRNPGYVIRGGGWADYAATCRSAKRFYQAPQTRLDSLGFRIVSAP